MAAELKIAIGQCSDKGRKDVNQDFHGALIPPEPLLSLKGIALAIADGISSSSVSEIAAESAVKGFLTDYYCTSESWSVKTSAQRVIAATNSWLHSETMRSQHAYDRDKGYVCTLSAAVFKATTAHLFHIGDSRIYRISGADLEQLTTDHRIILSSEQNYLGRAMGVNPQVEIDYHAIKLQPGDVYVMATDGVYGFTNSRFIVETIKAHPGDLDRAARIIVDEALAHGSDDNLTVQIARIDALPTAEADDLLGLATPLPPPPLLQARDEFDGYRIVREIHDSSRSHIYLAVDNDNNALVTLKLPSIDLRDNADYLRRFMMEEWVARRVTSPHVLKPQPQTRRRNYLYVAMEYIDGQTLTQWMIDHPSAGVDAVRGIVEQVASGIQAFHRMEMLHQDLRPENIMIDRTGTAKIIDFGSTLVTGVIEASPLGDPGDVLGTVQYTAPEYFLGQGGTPRSDQFSLAVIAYQMLTGRLPYGARMAQARTRGQQMKIPYASARDVVPALPAWIDGALRRATHPDPARRYEELSEFIFDLRHPNAKYLDQRPTPLIERNPLMFWKVLSFALAAIILMMLIARFGLRL